MKKIATVLAAAVAALILTPSAPAAAYPHSTAPPASTLRAADKMGCAIFDKGAALTGPENHGVECRVKGQGRFYVLRYENASAAVKSWADWFSGTGTSTGSYMVRHGRLFIVPIDYEEGPALYAAEKAGGKVLRFLP